MKIATLSNAAALHTRRWVEYFRERGHDVRLWSLEVGPSELGAARLASIPAPGFIRYPLATPAALRALEAFRPDVVDAHFVPNYGLIGALTGVRPLVVSAWGSDLLLNVAADPIRAARARYVLERADAVIADSDNLAAAARALGGGERVHAIPWGIDPRRFRPRGAREPGLILSTRMHEAVYDLPTILEGVRPVLERRPNARLAIAGSGALTESLRRRAARDLPHGRVEFVGLLDPESLAAWLARAEVYVSASRSDSTSLSLLEAMAAGAIPVVTDLDGNREWVADGDGARLFPIGDAPALTQALDRALDDPAWGERARARNRAVIETRGDRAVNMARVEALFASLARG
jgi:glycosyltransferase involved in cell wall biosynthesis